MTILTASQRAEMRAILAHPMENRPWREMLAAALDTLDAPCGSCHPCNHWAAETWRRSGGPLPHKHVVDEMRAALDRVETLAKSWESGPEPDVELAEQLRAAVRGESGE